MFNNAFRIILFKRLPMLSSRPSVNCTICINWVVCPSVHWISNSNKTIIVHINLIKYSTQSAITRTCCVSMQAHVWEIMYMCVYLYLLAETHILEVMELGGIARLLPLLSSQDRAARCHGILCINCMLQQGKFMILKEGR